MNTGEWISILSVIATAFVAIVGILTSEKRHREQIENERRSRNEQLGHERVAREEELSRERERSERHREDVPQFEFDMDVGLIKKKGTSVLVEFRVILNNRGNVKQDIKSIKLRIRTINANDKLEFWKDSAFRLSFPHKIFETEIIPKRYKFIFVEPNVKQILNYTTILTESVELVSARAEFSYGRARKGSRGSKHSVEKVFAING